MFGSAFNDPFFSDLRSDMREMNRGFDQMFGFGSDNLTPALDYDSRKRRSRRQSDVARRDVSAPSDAVQPFGNLMADPFSMMSSMRQSMSALQQQASDPNSGVHCFTSSSFYSYSSDGRNEPHVIEAHKAERRAPGGVRETRQAYRNSDSGVAKMAIGHHLDDRAHIIERNENSRTGQREQRNEYRGFEENEAGRFNEEWQQRARGAMFDSQSRQLNQNSRRTNAIEHGNSNDRSDRKRK